MDSDFVCSLRWMLNVNGPERYPPSIRKNVTQSAIWDGWIMSAESWAMRWTASGSWLTTGLSFSSLAWTAAAFSKSREFDFESRSLENSRSRESPPESKYNCTRFTSAEYSSSVHPLKQGARHIFIS